MGQKIDFAQNVNALGAPKGFHTFVSNNSNLLLNYPDPRNKDLNSSLAKFLGVKEKSVAYVNGSTEAFFSLPIFLKKTKALIVQPTFWEYEVANKKANKKTKTFLLNESSKFKLDFEKLNKEITDNAAVYLCNPNNPTSTLFGRNEFIRVIRKHKKTDFVVDETYLIFRHDYEKLTLIKHAHKLKNLYVVSSLSKIFALPGIRAGFVVSNPNNISKYIEYKTPYNVSPLSTKLTEWLLTQKKYINETRKYYQINRVSFYNSLKKLGNRLLVFEPKGNFIIAKILTDHSSTEITNYLLSKGIIIRNGAELPYLNEKWIRFNINKCSYNMKLLSELKTFFESK